eukprot:scaffold1224_cov191-Pinguiococcus_pyrenoidosus.AAC.15
MNGRPDSPDPAQTRLRRSSRSSDAALKSAIQGPGGQHAEASRGLDESVKAQGRARVDLRGRHAQDRLDAHFRCDSRPHSNIALPCCRQARVGPEQEAEADVAACSGAGVDEQRLRLRSHHLGIEDAVPRIPQRLGETSRRRRGHIKRHGHCISRGSAAAGSHVLVEGNAVVQYVELGSSRASRRRGGHLVASRDQRLEGQEADVENLGRS